MMAIVLIGCAGICGASDSLVSERSRSFENIERLAPVKMCNQDFWFILRDLPEDRTTGLEKEAFLKHAGYLFYDAPCKHIGKDGTLGERVSVTGGKVPVVCYMLGEKGWEGNYYHPEFMKAFRTEEAREWQKEWGDAFIGLVHLEGNWNVVKRYYVNDQWPALVNMPFPANKEESYRLIEAYFKKYLLLDDLPVLPGSIGFLDHHTLRWGARATTTYFGSNPLYAQLQSAFARGAARQFGKFWHVYYANWGVCVTMKLKGEGAGGNFDGGTLFNYRSLDLNSCTIFYMELYKTNKYSYAGAQFGADVKASMRPNYYYCYMAGANSLQNESDGSRFRYAGYDPHSPPELPLIRNFREDKIYPSPVVDLYREIDAYVKKQPRGIPYTPFAVLLDRHHGYIQPNSATYFTFAPLERGDYQINALFDTMFPFERSYRNINLAQKAKFLREIPAECNCFINLPYGNIFDVLNNDCSQDILSAYPVVLLTGLQGEWPDLTDKLVRYVKNGGTLVMDVSQIRKEMPAEMIGAETSGEMKKGRAHVDLEGNKEEEEEYSYQKVKLKNGEALYLDSESRAPLLVRAKYGRGVVLLSAVPQYLDNREKDKAKALKLYDIMLRRMIEEVMPVKVRVLSGGIDYSLNKRGKEWLVTLINYDGVTHGMGRPVEVDKAKTARIRVEAEGKYDEAEDTISGEKMKSEYEGRTILNVSVEPGEIKIIKLAREREEKQ